jgi:hypothetical protein
MFDYIDRLVVTSLFPFIKEEWGLSDAQLGVLVSVVYWSIVAFTFPVSIISIGGAGDVPLVSWRPFGVLPQQQRFNP